MLPAFLLLFDLAVAAPFVTTWRTTTANQTIRLPPAVADITGLVINWGDSTPTQFLTPGDLQRGVATHMYASPNTYNVSLEGQFYWEASFLRPPTTSTQQLIDIVSWGDGITAMGYMLTGFPNLQVSAPPNTQPIFPPNTYLTRFFSDTAFNSSLDWDLQNVIDISQMFCNTPLNQPVTFRNTQGVEYMNGVFDGATQFNQDLSGWDTGRVGQCNSFCRYCGLPIFPSCNPCGGSPRITDEYNMSVCSIMTASPSTAPSTAAPTVGPSAAPSVAPSSGAPSSAAPSAAPPADVSPASAAVPSLACGLLVVLALGFRL